MKGRLIVLSGPGGVGKSTIVSHLRQREDFYLSVSVTTRLPREGEIDGLAYHFVDNERFEEMVSRGEFLEWAEFAGARYGTPKAPVVEKIAEGKNVLLEIEIAGARQVKAALPEALLVFLQPPTFQDLEERIKGRGTDTPERISARLDLAKAEMAAAGEFDRILTNHRVEDVVAALVALAAAQ
jgi:guanylate kinase